MCKLDKKNGLWRIDPCIKELIDNLNWIRLGVDEKDRWNIASCCCGHGKYPMTIVVESPHGKYLEICSDIYIPRKKRFYKKDKQGYYFIPETIQSNQRICECSHKEWDEHKSSFHEYKGLKMVAQECNVKGCKCKKFKPSKKDKRMKLINRMEVKNE